MTTGDLVKLKNTDVMGIITNFQYRGFDHRGRLKLCRVSIPSTNEAVWVFDYDLEKIQ